MRRPRCLVDRRRRDRLAVPVDLAPTRSQLWVARLDPAWFGAGVAAAGCALAYGLLSAQQTLTEWLADRRVTALRELHAELSEALGTEQANQFMGWKLERLRAGARPAAEAIFGDDKG